MRQTQITQLSKACRCGIINNTRQYERQTQIKTNNKKSKARCLSIEKINNRV